MGRSPDAPIPCPDCGGKMWDNSADKKSPRSPDYRCKSRDCGKSVWIRDLEKSGAAATAPAGARAARPPLVLDKMLRECIIQAQTMGKELFKDGEVAGLAEDLTLKLATTLFIARSDGKGILNAEKKALAELQAKAKAEAEKKAREAEERRKAEELRRQQEQRDPPDTSEGWPPVDNDDDLPF